MSFLDGANTRLWVRPGCSEAFQGLLLWLQYVFSPISTVTGQFLVDMNARKNNHAQSILSPHLVVVLASVVHTQSFIETGMSLTPCPFKSVAKLSMECRIRHISLDSREDLYSATVCLEPP